MSRPKINYTLRESQESDRFIILLFEQDDDYVSSLKHIDNSSHYISSPFDDIYHLPSMEWLLEYRFNENYSSYCSEFSLIRHDRDIYSHDWLLQHGYSVESDFYKEHLNTLRKPHWHILIRKSSSTKLGLVARQFCVPSRFVQVATDYNRFMRYLCHRDSPNKMPYDPHEIYSSIPIEDLLEYFNDDFKALSPDQLYDYIMTHNELKMPDFLIFARNHKLLGELKRNFQFYQYVINTRADINISQNREFHKAYPDFFEAERDARESNLLNN